MSQQPAAEGGANAEGGVADGCEKVGLGTRGGRATTGPGRVHGSPRSGKATTGSHVGSFAVVVVGGLGGGRNFGQGEICRRNFWPTAGSGRQFSDVGRTSDVRKIMVVRFSMGFPNGFRGRRGGNSLLD